ncbi:MAG TPA: cyclic nucleotide-binding domain-containing protein [Anaeromyxobacteraceae bacterium]|nr:cyclic nucleotide-binding domain-containing protein [Anaeromyxobacteraceae bacterium]
MSVAEALRRAPLFRGFSDTGLLIFASIALERTAPAGTVLVQEDAATESLFLVRSGSVRLVQRGPDGDQDLGTLGPGAHLGALALLAPGPSLVGAIAATDAELIELRSRDFARLQPQKPQACLKLALAIAADLARTAAEARGPLRDALRRAART